MTWVAPRLGSCPHADGRRWPPKFFPHPANDRCAKSVAFTSENQTYRRTTSRSRACADGALRRTAGEWAAESWSPASIDEFDGSARADELGKWRSSSTWCRQETRRATRNSSCISGSTKYDRRAYRSSARTFRGRPAHYCIERIPSRSWNDDWKRSSSSSPPRFRVHVARRRNAIVAVGLATPHFNLINKHRVPRSSALW